MQGMTNVDLVGRPKNLYAVWKKMQTKGKLLKDMYDLRALRIVVRGGKAACYDILQKVGSCACVWGGGVRCCSCCLQSSDQLEVC